MHMNCDWHMLQIKKIRLPFTERPLRINKMLDMAISIALNKLTCCTFMLTHGETSIIIILFRKVV